ncbi:MAG: hypothetical protein AB7K36_02355 [Chloroflexota bacterium]
MIQPDGKIVVGGKATTLTSPTQIAQGLALVRYSTDGNLDTTFGNGGVVLTLTTLPFNGIANNTVLALALQPDGKIVAAGGPLGGGVGELVRYNPDGSLDTSFGSGGRARAQAFPQSPFSPPTPFIVHMVLQANGKIIVQGGQVYPGSRITRYNADGSVDTSYGSAGVLTIDDVAVPALALQSDGKLLLAGTLVSPVETGVPPSFYISQGFVLTRYNPDGGLDTAFGTAGRFVTGTNGHAYVSRTVAVLVQNDGNIVVGGSAYADGLTLVRFSQNGSLDPGFGTGGQVITSTTGSGGSLVNLTGLALAPDGKLIGIAGFFVFANGTSRTYPSLVRYQTSGGGGVGGRDLGIAPQPESIALSWQAGTDQIGYRLAHYPSGSWPLPTNAISYTDTAPAAGLNCYQLVALGASSVLANSDALCAELGIRSPGESPSGFTLRLNQSTTANLTWESPGDQIASVLAVLQLERDVYTSVYPAFMTGVSHTTERVPTCYVLYMVYETIVENTDLVCALPGQSQFGAAATANQRVANRGAAATTAQADVQTATESLNRRGAALRQDVEAKLPVVRTRLQDVAARLRGRERSPAPAPSPSTGAPPRRTAR